MKTLRTIIPPENVIPLIMERPVRHLPLNTPPAMLAEETEIMIRIVVGR
jgi:hypothetical protein